MLYQAQPAIERAACGVVALVPGRERRQPPRWYLPPSTSRAFQRVANLTGGKGGQFSVGHCDYTFAALFELHWSGGNLDFEATIACPDLQGLTRTQT